MKKVPDLVIKQRLDIAKSVDDMEEYKHEEIKIPEFGSGRFEYTNG